MIARLENSIEKLYETFDKYQSGPTMVGSSNYGKELNTWNRLIFKKPLRELNEDDLSRFTGKAITTWGNVRDFKHFLPRIFELIAELRSPYEVWIAFGKLTLADWKNWESNEQKVIHEFLISLWENIVNDDGEKAEWEFKEYFAAITHFYPSFTDVIAIWNESKSRAGIKHLANFILEEQTAIFDRKKIPGFYDQSENIEEFIGWLLSDAMLNKIEQQYFQFETDSIADQISWAEQIITTQRKKAISTI